MEIQAERNRIMMRAQLVALALGLVLGTSTTLRAQQPAAQSDEELAKQLANPVSSLVSLPVQFNWESGVGPDEGLRSIVNFQPVLPMQVNDDWNLIGRFILPFIGQPPLVTDGQSTFGTGDILLSGFLSPAQPGAAVWGVGPALTLPTTTDPFLGSGKWSAGPATDDDYRLEWDVGPERQRRSGSGPRHRARVQSLQHLPRQAWPRPTRSGWFESGQDEDPKPARCVPRQRPLGPTKYETRYR